ncbi:hypothetical protein CBL_05438 [Carabus blaptoides fortunei]
MRRAQTLSSIPDATITVQIFAQQSKIGGDLTATQKLHVREEECKTILHHRAECAYDNCRGLLSVEFIHSIAWHYSSQTTVNTAPAQSGPQSFKLLNVCLAPVILDHFIPILCNKAGDRLGSFATALNMRQTQNCQDLRTARGGCTVFSSESMKQITQFQCKGKGNCRFMKSLFHFKYATAAFGVI